MRRVSTLAIIGGILAGLALGCSSPKASAEGDEQPTQKTDGGQKKPTAENIIGTWVITKIIGSNDPQVLALEDAVYQFDADGKGKFALVIAGMKTPQSITWKLEGDNLKCKLWTGVANVNKIKSLTADKMVLGDPDGNSKEAMELTRQKEAAPPAARAKPSGKVTFTGKWSGRYSNNVGEKGPVAYEFVEDERGGITGVEDESGSRIKLVGERLANDALRFECQSTYGVYQFIGQMDGDELQLHYIGKKKGEFWFGLSRVKRVK